MYIKHHYKHFDVLDLCWYNITIRKYIPYASINRFPIHQAETFESKYNLKISRCHWIDFDNVDAIRKCINAIFVFPHVVQATSFKMFCFPIKKFIKK